MGSIVKKKVKGKVYLYWSHYVNGARVDDYIGPEENAEARAEAERLEKEEIKRRYEQLKKKARAKGVILIYRLHGAQRGARA